MADALLPLLLCGLSLWALHRREHTYDLLMEGAAEGLRLMARILPSLILLLSGVSMLRASGFLDSLHRLLAPALSRVGIPPETAMLVLIRPISGSAALAVGAELISAYGPDSPVGRTAAVMLGSTETTFYVLHVYLGACGIRSSRYAPYAALGADCMGFVMAAATVRWFYP